MAVEYVVDASVAAALFFPEVRSADAWAFVRSAPSLIAPDLIFAELASVAAKKTRRGEIHAEVGRAAVARLDSLVSATALSTALSVRAFDLAAAHGFSAYDALYLSLAEARSTFVVTADDKLVRRAQDVGLASLVHALDAA